MTIAIGEQILAADVVGGANLPSGVILLWAGTIANIPTGFLICDGNNSTPNLLAKFVEGVATAATNPGATGGNVSHTHTISNTPNQVTGPGGLTSLDSGTTGGTDGRPPFYDIAFIMKS